MVALETLLQEIMQRWHIPPERVIGHSDMAVNRKFDPGPRFDWPRLARQDLSVWPLEGGCAGDFISDAKAFGYAAPDNESHLLAAFRLRFRPWATGPLDDTDRALMHDLASRYPVDRRAFSA